MNSDSVKAEQPMGFARWCGFAALLAAAVLLWQLRHVLIELFGSVVLAVALSTLVSNVQERLGWRRRQALLASLLLVLLLIAVLATILIPPFVQQFEQLISQLPRAANVVTRMATGGLRVVTKMVYGQAELPSNWLQSLNNPSSWGLGRGVGQLVELAGDLGGGLLQVLFVVAIAVMLTAQPQGYRDVAVSLAPSHLRRRFRDVLDLCASALSSWMVGVLISSICVGLMAFVGLSLLGVKLTTANALLAGMLNVIPNLGPAIGTIFPMSVALLENPWKALAVLVLYVVIQNLESYVITPSVMHHQLKLLPGLTLAAQVIFTVLFGPLGLLLSLPLAVCLQVLIKELLIHDLLDQQGMSEI